MKKFVYFILSFIICLISVLSLVGCNNNSNNEPSVDSNNEDYDNIIPDFFESIQF